MIRRAIVGPMPGRASNSACVAALMLTRLPAELTSASRLGFDRPFSAGGPLAASRCSTTRHRRPSLWTTTVPSRSVRSRGMPNRASNASVSDPGWPYSLPAPTLATASSGRIRAGHRASVPLSEP